MFTKLKKRLANSGEFPNRIRNRARTFWEVPDAEIVRNQRMSATDDLSCWKDVMHWQRKLSNKGNAKEFAIKNGCKVADLYWRGNDVDTIDFNALPANYVIRPTIGHSSKMVFVMKQGMNLFDKKPYTPGAIREILRQTLIEDPAKEFLFEEFLKNENGETVIPDDYKFFCFNGEVAAFSIINRLSPKTGFEAFYDKQWNRLPEIISAYPPPQLESKKPACWDEMLSKVNALSKSYGIFVRIDFYATDKGAVFGEFTPTPALGRNYTRFGKKLLLKYWDTYCKGDI